MWMDIAQDGDPEPRQSDDEDTVYDRTNPFYDDSTSKNPFEQRGQDGEGNSAEMRMPMLEEQDTRCGLCSWRPHFMQKFANKTMFTVVFTIAGVFQSSIWSYYTANISTVEKRFHMDSISSGVLLLANELAQVLMAVLFSYFNFRRHRAKLLTLGVALTSLSCFLMASPHFFMGSGSMSLSLLKKMPDLPQQTFVTIPDNEAYELEQQDMKMPEALALVQQTAGVIFSLTGTSTTLDSTVSSAQTNPSTSTNEKTGTTLTNIITTSAEDFKGTNSSSKATTPATTIASTSSPPPPPTTTDYSPSTTKITNEETTVFHSLLHDEMSSVWPTCQRDVEHISTSSNSNKTDCEDPSIFERKLAFGLIFTANFIFGIAFMLYLICGGPFSEDSTIFPNEIPRIFGVTMSIRLIGSFFGYLFAWSCLTEFINPMESLIQIDSRWLGAYWMGWICLSLFMAIFTLIFSLFPRQSPREYLKKRSLTHDTGLAMLLIPSIVPFFGGAELKTAHILPSALNIYQVFKGFIRNRVFVLLTLSSTAHIFVAVGYLTFLPKYLEFMFRLRANDAALLTGISSVPFQVAGLMLSGAFISRYLPSSKEISHWSCVVSALQIVSLMIISFLGCDTNKIDISPLQLGSSNDTMHHCSGDCSCGRGPPIPVCDLYTGVSYYSPCHAGCEEVVNQTGLFSECSCLSSPNVTLVEGFCPGDGCANGLVAFLVFVCLGQFLRGSSVVGRMLLSYKSLQADQRAAIIGLTMLILSVVSIIPSAVVFGSLFESACLVRDASECSSDSKFTRDSMGNCWLYSDSSLRFTYNLASAAFMVVAFALDAVLWKNRDVQNLRIYDGELRQLTSPPSAESNNNQFSTVPLS